MAVAKERKGKKRSLAALDALYLEALQGEAQGDLPVFEPERPEELLEAGPEAAAEAEAPRASLLVNVSNDGMEAVLRAVAVQDAVSVPVGEWMIEELKRQGIVFGIDGAVIYRVEEAVRANGYWQGEEVVARGKPPATCPPVSYAHLSEGPAGRDGTLSWRVHGEPVAFADLAEALASDDLDTVATCRTRAKAVHRGDVLALFSAEGACEAGTDVYGQPVFAQQEAALAAGDNVTVSKDGQHYEATAYGYLYVGEGRLSVRSPIWIAPDRMAAYFVNLPQFPPGCLPTAEELRQLLDRAGIKHGRLEQTIDKLCQLLKAGREVAAVTRVAAGIPPRQGRDAHLELRVSVAPRAGTVREDDSIDLRNRNLVHNVQEGDLVAEKILASRGRMGQDLFGTKLPARDGRDAPIQVREGIASLKKEGRLLYYARQAGMLLFTDSSLAVVQAFRLDGDIDYATGNVETAKDLYVGGSVTAGFTVRSAGNAAIGGSVDLGATVVVEGDLLVGGGIIGETTKVVVHGNLQAAFIQDAQVIVKGDLTIGSYIFNGQVRSGGRITVQRGLGSHGGRVVGGMLCASYGIEASSVGSPTNPHTVLALQADPELTIQQNRLLAAGRMCEQNIARMMRTVGLESVDQQAIRDLIEGLPPEKKKQTVKILTHLNRLLKQKRAAAAEERAVREKIDKVFAESTIRVTGEVFQGSQVLIGNRRFTASYDMGPAVFQLRDGRIIY